MKFVRNVEGFFEKYIEGFFDKKLSGELQPVEIAKSLARIMEKEKSIGISSIYVPNEYCIYLQPDDFEKMSSYQQTICQDLEEFLCDEARKKEYVMTGTPVVRFERSNEKSKLRFHCTAIFNEPVPSPEKAPDRLESDVEPITRVFNKIELSGRQKVSCVRAMLTVVEGADLGLKVPVGVSRVHIGRRESNEMPLTDVNTSRLHAYVVFDEGSHILHDANSLNGTYVNNHRIAFKQLKNHDQIRAGNTVILYEVNESAE